MSELKDATEIGTHIVIGGVTFVISYREYESNFDHDDLTLTLRATLS